jgi:hypothetical protein
MSCIPKNATDTHAERHRRRRRRAREMWTGRAQGSSRVPAGEQLWRKKVMRLESLDSLESLTRLSAYGPHEDILKKTSIQPRRNAVMPDVCAAVASRREQPQPQTPPAEELFLSCACGRTSGSCLGAAPCSWPSAHWAARQ